MVVSPVKRRKVERHATGAIEASRSRAMEGGGRPACDH